MTGLDIDFVALFGAVGICLQIFVVNLLLSADNALVIALASRALPPAEMRQAVLLGTLGAIGLRVLMAALVVVMLQIPYLKLVAGVTLLLIAVRLGIGPVDEVRSAPARADLVGAVLSIIAADAVMSLDNVVAIAAISQGSLLLMAFGLALCIPMLIKGSALMHGFLANNARLVILAAMFLGWLAGQIAVTDPAIASTIETSAPALVFAVPAACAVFVLWEGRILSASRVRTERGSIDAD